MPDLLTHVLVAYVCAKLLSMRLPWLSTSYVTAVMLGATLPDLNRSERLLPSAAIEAVLGVPFSWGGLHRGGPILVTVLLLAVLLPEAHRRRAALTLGFGAATHLVLDLFLVRSGSSFPLLWPLTDFQPTLPGLYSSQDVMLAPTMLVMATVVWVLVEEDADRRNRGEPGVLTVGVLRLRSRLRRLSDRI